MSWVTKRCNAAQCEQYQAIPFALIPLIGETKPQYQRKPPHLSLLQVWKNICKVKCAKINLKSKEIFDQ